MWDYVQAHPFLSLIGAFIVFLIAVALRDIFQRKQTIKHNFPIVGHIRYWLETIGPELRQYWVASDQEELPFNRSERAWIYASAKGQNNTFGFGTAEQIYGMGYPIIKNAVFPFPEAKATYPGDDPTAVPCLKVMGEHHGRRRPYRPESIVNISAMSFGSLGSRAVSSLNKGAKEAHCYHNTGEGGVSPYHKEGADVMWELGTGYFGARDANGNFSLDVLADECQRTPQIRAIEIKLPKVPNRKRWDPARQKSNAGDRQSPTRHRAPREKPERLPDPGRRRARGGGDFGRYRNDSCVHAFGPGRKALGRHDAQRAHQHRQLDRVPRRSAYADIVLVPLVRPPLGQASGRLRRSSVAPSSQARGRAPQRKTQDRPNRRRWMPPDNDPPHRRKLEKTTQRRNGAKAPRKKQPAGLCAFASLRLCVDLFAFPA